MVEMIRMSCWLLIALCTPALSFAQTPGAAEQSLDAALGQSLSAQPVPGQSFVSVSASGTLTTGRAAARGWSVDGIASHVNASGWLFRAEAEMGRMDMSLPPTSSGPLITVEDSQLVSGIVMHGLRKRLSFITIAAWRRDRLLELEYRTFASAGIGLHLADSQKFSVMVAPMFAGGAEKRSFTVTGDSVADIAVLQTLSYRPHDKFGFDQFLSWHVDTTSTRDRYFDVNLAATSKITKYVSLKVYYQHQYASLVPAETDPVQNTVGTALQFTFQRHPPTATSK